MKKITRLNNQKGFTLLEIIAVLMILGVLAAVALPRYISFKTEADNKTIQAALGEAKVRVNMYAAKEIYASGAVNTGNYTTANLGSDLGDFTLATTSGATVSLAVSGKGSPIPASLTTSGTVALPASF